jgi:DNA topoisomerase-1
MAPDELTVEKAEELSRARPATARSDAPEWDREITVKTGRYGPYVTETLEEGATEKPRAASLFKSMSPETVTLEEAVRLLSLPRVARRRPADGEEVTAQNGRYGPYVKKDTESRSLESEEQLFAITLRRRSRCWRSRRSAAAAGRRSRRCASSAPIRVSSKPGRSLKKGRLRARTIPTARRTRAFACGDEPETRDDRASGRAARDRRSKEARNRRSSAAAASALPA